MTAADITSEWPEWKRNYRLTKYCGTNERQPMIIENEIRRAVLAGKSEFVRGLLLNDSQVELVRAIESTGSMDTATLAKQLGVSLQNASAKLHRLYTAGYLHRKMVSAESGGIEYVYTAVTQ